MSPTSRVPKFHVISSEMTQESKAVEGKEEDITMLEEPVRCSFERKGLLHLAGSGKTREK